MKRTVGEMAKSVGWVAFGPGTERASVELQGVVEDAARACLGWFDVIGPDGERALLVGRVEELVGVFSEARMRAEMGEGGEFAPNMAGILAILAHLGVEVRPLSLEAGLHAAARALYGHAVTGAPFDPTPWDELTESVQKVWELQARVALEAAGMMGGDG